MPRPGGSLCKYMYTRYAFDRTNELREFAALGLQGSALLAAPAGGAAAGAGSAVPQLPRGCMCDIGAQLAAQLCERFNVLPSRSTVRVAHSRRLPVLSSSPSFSVIGGHPKLGTCSYSLLYSHTIIFLDFYCVSSITTATSFIY